MNPGRTSIDSDVALESEMEKKAQKKAIELPEDPPFHVLILGNFGGPRADKESDGLSLLVNEIDRDEYDAMFGRIRPQMAIEVGDESAINIDFRELDDFHPDSLFKNLSIFDEVRDMRRRLLNESTYKSAAQEVKDWFADELGGVVDDLAETVTDVVVDGGGGLLDDVLGSKSRDAGAYREKKNASLSDFVKKVAEPYVIRIDENEQASLLELLDSATSDLMRAIVQNKEFKELESNWRGLYLACRRIETSKDLKLFFIDIVKDDFLNELKQGGDPGLVDILAHGSASNGNSPWAVIAGAYGFEVNVDDIAALIRVSGIAALSNSPFVAHVRPQMLGIDGFAGNDDFKKWDTESDTNEGKLWTALRTSEHADVLGLLVPRLMARLPYGAETEPVEGFAFEELESEEGTSRHDEYLWMNPVFGFSVLIANSFTKNGWEMGGRYELDLTGLPMHFVGAGETKPCAEVEMTDAGMGVLLEQGMMAFASFRDTDRVRLGGVQSVNFPLKSLAGRWS